VPDCRSLDSASWMTGQEGLLVRRCPLASSPFLADGSFGPTSAAESSGVLPCSVSNACQAFDFEAHLCAMIKHVVSYFCQLGTRYKAIQIHRSRCS